MTIAPADTIVHAPLRSVEYDQQTVGNRETVDWILKKLLSASGVLEKDQEAGKARLRPVHCNIVAEPGLGKKYVLDQVNHILKQDPHPQDFWRIRISLTTFDLQGSYLFWELAEAKLNVDLKTLTMLPEPVVIPSLSVDEQTTEDDTLKQRAREAKARLYKLLQRAVDEGKKVVFIVDDFDALVPALTLEDVAWLRALALQYDNIRFVVATADPVSTLFLRWSDQDSESTQERLGLIDRLVRSFEVHRLPLLERAVAETMVKSNLPAPMVRLEVVDRVLDITGEHPYLIKQAIRRIRAMAAEAGRNDANSQLEMLFPQLYNDEQIQFLLQTLFARRTPSERRTLILIARGVGKRELESEDERAILRAQLEGLCLLKRDKGGKFRIFSTLFKLWLLREAANSNDPGLSAAMSARTLKVALKPAQPVEPEHRSLLPNESLSEILQTLEAELSPKELELFRLLAHRAGEVMSVDHIMQHIWPEVDMHECDKQATLVVPTTISRLRKKLELYTSENVLISQRGRGYKLRGDALTLLQGTSSASQN
jgi:DNA-binding winged helix-turn-helix (wHTH) protein